MDVVFNNVETGEEFQGKTQTKGEKEDCFVGALPAHWDLAEREHFKCCNRRGRGCLHVQDVGLLVRTQVRLDEVDAGGWPGIILGEAVGCVLDPSRLVYGTALRFIRFRSEFRHAPSPPSHPPPPKLLETVTTFDVICCCWVYLVDIGASDA